MRQSKAVKKFKRKLIRSVARAIYFTNWGLLSYGIAIVCFMFAMASMDTVSDIWLLCAIGFGVATTFFAVLGYRGNAHYNMRIAECRKVSYARIQARRLRALDNLELYRNLKDMESELQFLH